MSKFYDPWDEHDLARVEGILKNGMISYSLKRGIPGASLKEIHVAEEDMAMAEELLQQKAAIRS
ncbi:MAG: hypothetical protein FD174_1070 [Geobacteraceae bacterium]|nr:MAG: hypothetical protein FD174_1070 [Geobacteraceae bacterium]